MKKLSNDLEDNADIVMADIAEAVSSQFKRMGATPNNITTLSLLFGLFAIYAIIIGDYKLCALCYLISYFFDVLDGYYARKYKMISEFGDYYDHISDITKTSILMLILFYILFANKKYMYIVIIIVLYFIATTQMACQEKYLDATNSNHAHSNTISMVKGMCDGKNKEDIEETIKTTRLFGMGTVTLVITLIIYSLDCILQT